MGQLFKAAIEAQKNFIAVSSRHSKPSDSDLPKVLEPQSTAIMAITAFRDSSRRSPHFNHLSSVSEAIPALSWVCVSPTPGPHVKVKIRIVIQGRTGKICRPGSLISDFLRPGCSDLRFSQTGQFDLRFS